MSEPQLRAALRAREPLAPDPEAVFTGARRKIRRRRMASTAAAVVVTVGGLGVAAMALRPSSPEETRLPVAAPTAATVTAPALPFSFDVRGYTVVGWRSHSGTTEADYSATGPVVTVTASDAEPQVDRYPSARATVRGATATAWQLDSGISRVSWQVAPGKWLQVQGRGSVPEVVALAQGVVAGSAPAPAGLKSVQAPAGLRLVSWEHAAGYDVAQLCPDAADGPQCVTVTVTGTRSKAATPTSSTQRPTAPEEPAVSQATTSARSSAVPEVTPSQVWPPVARRIGEYEVVVSSPEADGSVLNAVAASVVLG